MKETRPRCDNVITEHPLVPTKGRAVYVEQGDDDVFFVRSTLVIKKLGDLEDPSHRIVTVETGNVEFDVRSLWEMVRGSQSGYGGELVEMVQNDVDLVG